VLNKIDHLQGEERAESLAFATEAVDQALGVPVPVYPVSARLALQGRARDDSTLLFDSGITLFEAALQQFLMEESGAVWQRSMYQQFARLLSEARLAAQLELSALSSRIDVVDANIRALADKKLDLLQGAADATAILAAEVRGIVSTQGTPKLELFNATLEQRLRQELDSWSASSKELGITAYRTALNARLMSEIRHACEVWEAETDATLQMALGQLCERLARGVQHDLNDVLRYSAQLFEIAFTPITADMLWRRRGEFSIKAWDEPPGLKALTDTLVSMLPHPMSKAIILREARRSASALVDMHTGRLRHALEERIQDNARAFQGDLVQGINRTLAGIEAAIRRGKELLRQGDAQVRPRRAELGDILAKIEELEDQARKESESTFSDRVTERAAS
jgi:hypothetical protein